MKRLRILVLISTLAILAPGPVLAQTASPRTPPGWKTYVNRVQGFSFAYPPLDKPIRRLDAGEDRVNRDEDMEKAVTHGRWVGLRNQSSDGRIDFLLTNERFDLESLKDHRPTGEEEPPPAVQEGNNTFYAYGAGGGGAEYPDQYFFNFKGKTLYIVFDGPYQGKSPTEETKKIESQMLTSFQTFEPAGIR
jgi:hypothetical protein